MVNFFYKLGSDHILNARSINAFGEELKGFKDNMLGKIESIETRQKKQLAGIKFILENRNSDKKNKNLILSDRSTTLNPILSPLTRKDSQAVRIKKSRILVK